MSVNTPTAGAPLCAPPDFQPRKPQIKMPALACDTHAHVLGPAAQYDYSPARVYTPPDCLPKDYRHMLDTLGVWEGQSGLLDGLRVDAAHLADVFLRTDYHSSSVMGGGSPWSAQHRLHVSRDAAIP